MCPFVYSCICNPYVVVLYTLHPIRHTGEAMLEIDDSISCGVVHIVPATLDDLLASL